jgi:hypothetical protein
MRDASLEKGLQLPATVSGDLGDLERVMIDELTGCVLKHPFGFQHEPVGAVITAIFNHGDEDLGMWGDVDGFIANEYAGVPGIIRENRRSQFLLGNILAACNLGRPF